MTAENWVAFHRLAVGDSCREARESAAVIIVSPNLTFLGRIVGWNRQICQSKESKKHATQSLAALDFIDPAPRQHPATFLATLEDLICMCRSEINALFGPAYRRLFERYPRRRSN